MQGLTRSRCGSMVTVIGRRANVAVDRERYNPIAVLVPGAIGRIEWSEARLLLKALAIGDVVNAWTTRARTAPSRRLRSTTKPPDHPCATRPRTPFGRLQRERGRRRRGARGEVADRFRAQPLRWRRRHGRFARTAPCRASRTRHDQAAHARRAGSPPRSRRRAVAAARWTLSGPCRPGRVAAGPPLRRSATASHRG